MENSAPTDKTPLRGPGRPKLANKEDILAYIENLPSKSASLAALAKHFNVSNPTLWRSLSELRSQDLVSLHKPDKSRNQEWTTKTASAYMVDPARHNGFVDYDPNRLRNYIPNKSQLLPSDVMSGLSTLSRTAQTRSASDVVARVRAILLVEMSYASSKLEGNEYSLGETVKLFEEGVVSDKKKASDTTMLLNHRDAISYILDKIIGLPIDPFTVKNIHAMLSTGLLEDASLEGQIRNHGVSITGSKYRPLSNQAGLSQQFDLMLDTANHICNPFEKSFFLLANLSYLQAFSDVNKRTARIVSNIPLMQSGLCPMSYYDFNKDVYEQATVHYYEMGATDRLAQAYLEGYSVSVDRYKDLLHHGGANDDVMIRAEFRNVIHSAVRNQVLDRSGNTLNNVVSGALEEFNKSDITEDKRKSLEHYVDRIVKRLHDGQLIIYGLTPIELKNFRVYQYEANQNDNESAMKT